jgi:glycerophosphoryl diester phosphodiesterase
MHAPLPNGLFSVPASLNDPWAVQRGFFCAGDMQLQFDFQGHRGARGLRPENTLPSFEIAIDHGVTAIETDVHLTRDGVPVLCHDPCISDRICSPVGSDELPQPATRPSIRTLTLAQLRSYVANGNPDPSRFPEQVAESSPLSHAFAAENGLHPFGIPSLAEFIAFVQAYAGESGKAHGKTKEQRSAARRLRFDLELKRVPFRPELIGDDFDGTGPSLLENEVVECVNQAGVLSRTIVRSFDHRCVRAIRKLEPGLTSAVLVAGTAPIDPVSLVRNADAQVYCPEFLFLDREQVERCHQRGVRVVPWTVNEVPDMRRLREWNVDGMTTDYPDRLRSVLEATRRSGVHMPEK